MSETNGTLNGHTNGQATNNRLPSTPVPHGGAAVQQPTVQSEGRTAVGQFATGNKFSRGNPTARRMAAFRSSLLGSLTEEKLKALGEKLYQLALDGNLDAAKLLLAYAIGKAPAAVDADRLDLDEWKLLFASPDIGKLYLAMADLIPPGDAVQFLVATQTAWEKLRGGALMAIHSRVYPDGDGDEDEKEEDRLILAQRAFREREARVGK